MQERDRPRGRGGTRSSQSGWNRRNRRCRSDVQRGTAATRSPRGEDDIDCAGRSGGNRGGAVVGLREVGRIRSLNRDGRNVRRGLSHVRQSDRLRRARRANGIVPEIEGAWGKTDDRPRSRQGDHLRAIRRVVGDGESSVHYAVDCRRKGNGNGATRARRKSGRAGSGLRKRGTGHDVRQRERCCARVRKSDDLSSALGSFELRSKRQASRRQCDCRRCAIRRRAATQHDKAEKQGTSEGGGPMGTWRYPGTNQRNAPHFEFMNLKGESRLQGKGGKNRIKYGTGTGV